MALLEHFNVMLADRSRFWLFMGDEILPGTNPYDRLAALKAALHYLREMGVMVLIVTHEPELMEFAESLRGFGFRNVHFSPSGEGRDFVLMPGYAQRSNGLAMVARKFSRYPRFLRFLEQYAQEGPQGPAQPVGHFGIGSPAMMP